MAHWCSLDQMLLPDRRTRGMEARHGWARQTPGNRVDIEIARAVRVRRGLLIRATLKARP